MSVNLFEPWAVGELELWMSVAYVDGRGGGHGETKKVQKGKHG